MVGVDLSTSLKKTLCCECFSPRDYAWRAPLHVLMLVVQLSTSLWLACTSPLPYMLGMHLPSSVGGQMNVANGIRYVANRLCNAFMFPVWRARRERVASYSKRVANVSRTETKWIHKVFKIDATRREHGANMCEHVANVGERLRMSLNMCECGANACECIVAVAAESRFPSPDSFFFCRCR